MLSCIYNGKPFTTKEEGYATKEKYRLGKQKQLLCPVCMTSVFFCEDGEKIAHFTHHKVGDCPIGTYRSYDYSTTEKHDRVVDKFIDWIKAQFPDIPTYPDYFISNELYTDIYFELGNVNIAIEIQFKNFNNPTYIKRRELYRSHNIKDIWFFIQENGEFSIGSPYQRTYYRENRRELYFYQIEEYNCKVYKGFAQEKWEAVGKDTLYDSISVTVPLEHIKIKNDGTLIIPELKYKFLQTLQEKRKKNKDWREAQKLYRERQKQESQRGSNYRPNNNFSNYTSKQVYSPIAGEYKIIYESQQEKLLQKELLLGKVQNLKKVLPDKAYTQEYKEYHFINENGKEYLNVIILYQGKEYNVKYLILNKQVVKNEMYLTCRKEHEPQNIKYSIDINPFLTSLKKIKIQKLEYT